MNSHVESDDDLHLDSKKLELNAHKVGFRDGVADGQDQNFQASFNDGFRQGFRNAFAISQYKAALFLSSHQNKTGIPQEPLLANPERGWCEFCKNPDFTNRKLDDLINQQIETTNRNLQYLNSKYSGPDTNLPARLDN